MKKSTKYSLIFIFVLVLLIPPFFGIYKEFLFITQININIVLFLALGVIFFLILNVIIRSIIYNAQSLEAMTNHNVVNAFITNSNKYILLTYFPMIMIIEELIFRFYLIGFLVITLDLEVNLAIFISSLIFSVYHVHTWFTYKNLRVLIMYLGVSFLLGLYNGYILISLGIIPCIVIHYGLVLHMYYSLYLRNFKD
ncbi:MAG: CPBP family intramembrane metalloprotease [Promethearchaeota archaeon]|nr:MAG: CPBP family intramembrane metalloprotease [Candidatus Lokiarchaeota archaeon]